MRPALPVRPAELFDNGAPSGGRVNASCELAFRGSDIAFAKSPLPALFESGQNVAARELVHRVGTHVEKERDLARVQKYVVSIRHHQLSKTPQTSIRNGNDPTNTRFFTKSSLVGLKQSANPLAGLFEELLKDFDTSADANKSSTTRFH